VTGIRTDELEQMCTIARRLWGPGRRWHPGEITWAVLTDPDGLDVRFVGEGFVWRQSDYTVILATRPQEAREMLASVAGDAIQVADRDLVLLGTLRGSGYEPVPDAPFDLDVRLTTTMAMVAVDLPAGYVVRSASPEDDLVAVHRTAWRPADLPFARGHSPVFATDAKSSFDAVKLTAVQAADGYRADLHVVVTAPDGSLAASCIAWFDVPTRAAVIEPLGVRPEHRNRGLAGATCLHAAQPVRETGGHELVIHPRGDTAYPAPRNAYQRVGFEPVGRAVLYAQS
jgi:GNAT superfamily N-acetyltransferase